MPHVIVKLLPGRSEEQKAALADRITQGIIATLRSNEESISIDIEEIRPEDWTQKVYEPEIQPRLTKLYKKPGYEPF